MRKIAASFVALASLAGTLAACSGSGTDRNDAGRDAGPDDAGDGVQCPLEPGTYRAVFVETSGTCGPIGNSTVVLTRDGGPPGPGTGPNCSGPVTFSNGMCDVAYDRECEIYEDGVLLGTVSFQGANTIVATNRIEGSFTRLSDGPGTEVDCVSSYDVTWTRL